MTDDYYEEKALAEISEKGFKAGEFVGELPDPTTHNEASALGGAGLGGGGGSKADRGAGGIYRAGGPTTIFGGSGWGPFSDGPLNAVRKSLLSRDNVTEENWMLMMAARVREADEEWEKWRQEARKVPEGVQGVYMGDAVLANGLPARVNGSKSKSVQRTVQEEEGVVVDDGEYQEGYPKRKKVVGFETETEAANSNAPLGVYDPHSNLIFCKYIPTSGFFSSPRHLITVPRSQRHPTDHRTLGSNARRLLQPTQEISHRGHEGGQRGLGSCMGRYRYGVPSARRSESQRCPVACWRSGGPG